MVITETNRPKGQPIAPDYEIDQAEFAPMISTVGKIGAGFGIGYVNALLRANPGMGPHELSEQLPMHIPPLLRALQNRFGQGSMQRHSEYAVYLGGGPQTTPARDARETLIEGLQAGIRVAGMQKTDMELKRAEVERYLERTQRNVLDYLVDPLDRNKWNVKFATRFDVWAFCRLTNDAIFTFITAVNRDHRFPILDDLLSTTSELEQALRAPHP